METYREGCVIELFFFQQQPRAVIACSLLTSSCLSEVVRFAAIIPKPKSMSADHIWQPGLNTTLYSSTYLSFACIINNRWCVIIKSFMCEIGQVHIDAFMMFILFSHNNFLEEIILLLHWSAFKISGNLMGVMTEKVRWGKCVLFLFVCLCDPLDVSPRRVASFSLPEPQCIRLNGAVPLKKVCVIIQD